MGLFGRKKSPEERLAKAREYFEKGDYEHAFLESHRLTGKKDPEACYYVGMYYLYKRFDKKMAKSFIEVAAAAGIFDAPWQLQLITGEAFRSDAPVTETEKVIETKPVVEEKKAVETKKVAEEKTTVKPAPATETEKVIEAKPIVEEKKHAETEKVTEEKSTVKPVPVTETVKVIETKPVIKAKPIIEEKNPVETKVAEEKSTVKPAPVIEMEKVIEAKPVIKAKPIVGEKNPAEPAPDAVTLYAEAEQKRLSGADAEALVLYERAAEMGLTIAQLTAAIFHELGSGTPVDLSKALKWYEKAAEGGSASACCKCGELYKAAGNNEKALHWYQVAGDTYGQHEGWRECAEMFLAGIGTPVDKKKALGYYKLCALQDDADAQCMYGMLSIELCMADRQNEKRPEAMKWIEKSALHGNSNAQHICAAASREGFWSAPDLAGAVYWYQQAAAQGNEEAAEELAALRAEEGSASAFSASAQELERIYNEALLLGEDFKKCKEATALLLRAAEGGLVKAQRRLGLVCGEKGSNFAVSGEVSLSWCARAVEADDAWAQTIRARYYERGLHGKSDLQKALALYKLAGEQGNLEAQLGCGRLLKRSCDETLPAQEYYARIKEAANWYMRAAQQNCLEGLRGVGESCEQCGDHFCTPEAKELYERASKCIEEKGEKAKEYFDKDALTTAMFYGEGKLEYDAAKAAYKGVLELGCTDAYNDLFRLVWGEKIHVQLEELYLLLEKAAEVRNQRAQVLYAMLLEKGDCPQFDPVLAKRYAQDAATGSDPELRKAAREVLRDWKR